MDIALGIYNNQQHLHDSSIAPFMPNNGASPSNTVSIHSPAPINFNGSDLLRIVPLTELDLAMIGDMGTEGLGTRPPSSAIGI